VRDAGFAEWLAVIRLQPAAEELIAVGRAEGIEPQGPLGQWLDVQPEALRALAEILGAQGLRFEEVMRNVNTAASAELEKLAAATASGNDVVRAGEVALREARTAEISLQVEKENLTAMTVKETLPPFVERLKEALIIRGPVGTTTSSVAAGLVTLGPVFGGYARMSGKRGLRRTPTICAAHPRPASGGAYCDMSGASGIRVDRNGDVYCDLTEFEGGELIAEQG
jgi:hypothetical protein